MLKCKLFPQQIEGSEYLIKHLGGNLWMEMRTGKTLTTLQALFVLGLWPALVVAPQHAFRGWEDQIAMAGGDLSKTQRLVGTAKQINKKLANPKSLNFMNYTQTWRRDVLNAQDWKAIILDESIRIGNLDTEVTSYFFNNATNNANAYKSCLSGSPASNDIFQLLPQLYWQGNGEIMGYKGPDGFDKYVELNWKYSDRLNKFVLGKKAHRKEILKYSEERSYQCTMKDIGRDSILCHRVSRVTPPASVRERINKLRIGDMYTSRTGKLIPLNPLVKAGFEMSLCAGRDPQTGEVFDLTKQKHILDEWDKNDKIPFIVFSRLKEPLKAMVELFRKMGGKGAYIDANVADSEQIIADFQNGLLDAIFGQTDSMKEAITADRADKIFYFNNSFSPDTRYQSQMRGTSLNKSTPVEIIDVVYKDCYEENLVEKLSNKKALSDEVVQNDYLKFDGKLI